jgi:hypothetical protein
MQRSKELRRPDSLSGMPFNETELRLSVFRLWGHYFTGKSEGNMKESKLKFRLFFLVSLIIYSFNHLSLLRRYQQSHRSCGSKILRSSAQESEVPGSIRNLETGEVLAQGKQLGGTGDTERI